MKRFLQILFVSIAVFSFSCASHKQGVTGGVSNSLTDSAQISNPVVESEAPTLSKGNLNFTLKDTGGKEVSLSDFKGRFVVVDFWATWCKPCVAEQAYVKKYQEELKDKDIVWLFVSFDNNRYDWKKAVKNYAPPGVHLLASKEDIEFFKKELRVKGIPYYVWVAKDGQILMSDAPHPSDTRTKRELIYNLDR